VTELSFAVSFHALKCCNK